jgi:hypothetical protein
LRWLEFRPGYAWVPWMNRLPYFASLHDDPRYIDLLRRIKVQ